MIFALLAVVCQPAVEVQAEPAACVLALEAGGSAELVMKFPLRLPAGRSWVSVRWDGDVMDGSKARIAGGAAVVGRQISGRTARLEIQSQQPLDGLEIAAPATGIKWSAQVRLAQSEGGIALSVVVSLSREKGTLAFDRVVLRTDTVELAGPGARLEPGQEVSIPLRPALVAAAEQRLEAGADDECPSRVAYVADRAIIELLGSLKPKTLNVVSEGGLRAASWRRDNEGRLVIDLGPVRSIGIRHRVVSVRWTALDFDQRGRVQGVDEVEEHELTVFNASEGEQTVFVRIEKLSTWDVRCSLKPAEESDTEVVFAVKVPARSQALLSYTVIKHSGTRAK